MNAPPANERLQFGIRALLIYTFGMAALVSMLVCKSPGTVFAAWLILGLFLWLRGQMGDVIVFASSIAWFFLAILLGYHRDVLDLFMFGCKIGGTVGFVTYHLRLIIR
jgi:hypothetical protein